MFISKTLCVFVDSMSDVPVLPSASSTLTISSEPVIKRRAALYQDKSTMTDPLLEIGKHSSRKRVTCCVIS